MVLFFVTFLFLQKF
jgi:4-aminobutyrate aminotransferase-like enzyme